MTVVSVTVVPIAKVLLPVAKLATEDEAEAPTAAIEMLLDAPAFISVPSEFAVTLTAAVVFGVATVPLVAVRATVLVFAASPTLIVPVAWLFDTAVLLTELLALAPTPATEMLLLRPPLMLGWVAFVAVKPLMSVTSPLLVTVPDTLAVSTLFTDFTIEPDVRVDTEFDPDDPTAATEIEFDLPVAITGDSIMAATDTSPPALLSAVRDIGPV